MDAIQLNVLLRHNVLGLLSVALAPALVLWILALLIRGGRWPWLGRAAAACWWTGLFGLVMAFVGEVACSNLLNRTYTCNRNERAMAEAVILYSQDFDNTLPPASGWHSLSRPFAPGDQATSTSCPRTGYRFGYALSSRAGGLCLDKVNGSLYETLLLFDHRASGPNDTAPRIAKPILARHDGFVNAAALDGHVSRYGPERIARYGW